MLTRKKFGIIAEVCLVWTPNPILDSWLAASVLNNVHKRGKGLKKSFFNKI